MPPAGVRRSGFGRSRHRAPTSPRSSCSAHLYHGISSRPRSRKCLPRTHAGDRARGRAGTTEARPKRSPGNGKIRRKFRMLECSRESSLSGHLGESDCRIGGPSRRSFRRRRVAPSRRCTANGAALSDRTLRETIAIPVAQPFGLVAGMAAGWPYTFLSSGVHFPPYSRRPLVAAPKGMGGT
jgi:hypothetical protein